MITFVASDGGSASNVGTATVTIDAVNDGPSADIAPAALRCDRERATRRSTARGCRSPTSTPAESVVTVQLRSISGLISAAAGRPASAIAGSGSPTLTLTGTLAQSERAAFGRRRRDGHISRRLGLAGPDRLAHALDQRQRSDRRGGAQWASDSATVNLDRSQRCAADHDPAGTPSTTEDTPARIQRRRRQPDLDHRRRRRRRAGRGHAQCLDRRPHARRARPG